MLVTGSESVCKLTDRVTLEPVLVNPPADCMKNGIAADREALYVACVRIHAGKRPFLPKSAL